MKYIDIYAIIHRMSKNESLPNKPPWLPDKEFLDGRNRQAIIDILGVIATDRSNQPFAEAAQAVASDVESGGELAPGSRDFMWARFMGVQHGTMEGGDGKVRVNEENYPRLRPLAEQLHYGGMRFLESNPADTTVEYGNSIILGGSAEEMPKRLRAARGEDPRDIAVRDTYLLVGQRQRWNGIPTEKDPDAILAAVSRSLDGVDMDKLKEKSPWLRDELRKKVEAGSWDEAFATEMAIGRLGLEAYFDRHGLIDWENGIEEIAPSESQPSIPGVPERENVLITYHLLDGTRATLLDAAAVPRKRGVPRPTSDSQIKELLDLGVLERNKEYPLSIVTNSPHYLRAATDVAIRILAHPETRDIVIAPPVSPYRPSSPENVLKALGEIPATYKADKRVHAVLRGEDPDARELADL